MATPHVLVMSGYGINCERETAFAFQTAGAVADIVHINDAIADSSLLQRYQILAFPGGFSYGDDTGSGKAFARRVRNHLWDEVRSFAEGEHLTLGVCNGFQILTHLGLLPAFDGAYGERSVALVHNDSARYIDRWVDLAFQSSSPWVRDIGTISLPIAHGEGKFYAPPEILERLRTEGQIAACYVEGEICRYQHLSSNPNGSLDDIAGITDASGKVLGMMPHPERAIVFTPLPDWPLVKERCKREGRELPQQGPGIKVFQNAVEYFK